MRRIYYKKLVRDRIPKRIDEHGGKYELRKLSDSDFKKELLRKVEEEAGGLSNARVKSEIISEMGDLLDVLKEIKKVFKISSKELSESRSKEFKRKGGFAKKLYLIWSEDTGYKSNERKSKK